MDFRIKYRRGRRAPEEARAAEQRERDAALRARGLAYGLSIPISMAAGPLAGWWAGAALDSALGTSYWTPVLIVIGTAAGLKLVVDMVVRLGRMQ